MKLVLLTKDPEVVQATEGAFQPEDVLIVVADPMEALQSCEGADLLFVDLLATLDVPHKIAGYERFALAKMGHAMASTTPLVLIAAPSNYDIDAVVGWPDFVFANVSRPLTYKIFRRATTWV